MAKREIVVNGALANLGLKAKDKVTGVKGIVTSVSFDLYGCIQLLVQPEVNKEGKYVNSYWLDENRVKITGKKPVMEQPFFVKVHGPENNKPTF